MEFQKNKETNNHHFFITIKQGDSIFGNFNKFEFDLDTSRNIVEQAEQTKISILDLYDIPEGSRAGFSWKIYRNQGNGYGMVTKSKNWGDED